VSRQAQPSEPPTAGVLRHAEAVARQPGDNTPPDASAPSDDALADNPNSAGVAAVYTLPIHVWVASDVLGTATRTQIGGVAAEILTPVPTGLSDGVTPPNLQGVPDEELHNPAKPWATTYAGFLSEPGIAIQRVGMHLSEIPGQPTAPQYDDGTPEGAIAAAVGESIEGWFDCVRSWVEILTGQDLDHRHPVYDAHSIGAGFRAWRPEGWQDTGIIASTPRITPVSLHQWTALMHKAAHAEPPPVEYLLSRDASAAFDRGNYRKTVLDSATALEIVLTSVFDAEGPRFTSRTGKPPPKLKNLGPLCDWLLAHGPALGADKQELTAVIEARNTVIHRAVSCPRMTAWAATHTIAKVIELHGTLN
jgi:hypothetical protein